MDLNLEVVVQYRDLVDLFDPRNIKKTRESYVKCHN